MIGDFFILARRALRGLFCSHKHKIDKLSVCLDQANDVKICSKCGRCRPV